jgi:two-component system response regulator YesN
MMKKVLERIYQKLYHLKNIIFFVKKTAKNGREALDLLPIICPDLILLDISMPIMNGIEFLKAISQTAYENTNIVILSGYFDYIYSSNVINRFFFI